MTVPLMISCSLLSALAGGLPQASLSSDSVHEQVADIVHTALSEPAPDLLEVEHLLIDLGPAAIEPLFELLVAGEVSGSDAPEAIEPPELLGPAGEDLLLAALSGLPHAGLRGILGALELPPAADELRAAHLALGATGDADDLDLLIRLTTPVRAEAGLGHSARVSCEDALASLLARHRDETWLVAKHYQSAPPALRAPLLRATERAHMDNEVALFADLLGVHPELDLLLLGQLARVGHPWVDDEDAVDRVRARLHSQDVREVLAAVIALAPFEDGESVETLIGLLEHEDPRLREQVTATLVRTTGRNFRGDAGQWKAWHLEAAEWWGGEAPALFEDLWSADRGRAAAAANELVLHPMYRREVERELLASLNPVRPELCAFVCRVLGALGSPRARERLEELAGNRDEWVSMAARGALEELSRRARQELTEPRPPKRR